MEQKKLWYALLCDEEDNDWGTGTFDRAEAIEKMNSSDGYYTQIAVIDANYDEDGKPTSDGVCVEEIRVAEVHPYIVIDEPIDCSGDYNGTDYDDLDEAISAAIGTWAHLTKAEKARRRVYVLESINPDVDAPNHYDGRPVYYPQEFAEKVRTQSCPDEMKVKVYTNHENVKEFRVGLDDYDTDASFFENVDAELDDITDELENAEVDISSDFADEIRTAIIDFFDAHNCGEQSEAEEVAEKIRESGEWDAELCAKLAELADMSEEYAAADGETFESVVLAAAEKLGVDVL